WKLAANTASMLSVMGAHWILGLVGLFALYWTFKLFPVYGIAALAGSVTAMLLFSILFLALMEWWSIGFRRLQPARCSIMDSYYWKIEHHWKMSETFLMFLFAGT